MDELTREQAAEILTTRAALVDPFPPFPLACRMGADALGSEQRLIERVAELERDRPYWWRCPTNPRHEYGLRQPAPADALCPDCAALNAELEAQKANERVAELERERDAWQRAALFTIHDLNKQIDRYHKAAGVGDLTAASAMRRALSVVESHFKLAADHPVQKVTTASPRRVSPEASERALRLRQSGDLIGGEDRG